MKMWHGATRFMPACGGPSAGGREASLAFPWLFGRKMNIGCSFDDKSAFDH